MSRRQILGFVQCWRSQSRRSCGELLCGCLAGAGSLANVNCSPLGFGIGGLFGLFWGQGATINNQFLIVSEVDRYDDPIRRVSGAFVSGARSGPELFGGLDSLPGRSFWVLKNTVQH